MSCASCNQNGPCKGGKSEIRSLRNQIVTLHNTTEDYEEKRRHKEMIAEIDSVNKSIDFCPDKALLYSLENYIENERSKRSK